jgi:molybdopterin/thiamine biosynthesis adenylyltransferase
MKPQADGRYSRQERFARIGLEGQQRISGSRIAIVGCGALGSAQAELLARAGAGYLRIIDRDYVEFSNLQRQLLFDESDAADARPKAIAARNRLLAVNSDVEVAAAVADLTASNADDLLGDVDLILDGTDNFETRYLVNDFAVSHDLPWVYGAAVGSYGIKMTVVPGQTACFRCVYPEPPSGNQPTCETAGVLGPVTAAIASLQVADALRILCGHAAEISGTIVTMDLWADRIRQVRAPGRDPDCPCCARREFMHLDGKRRAPISLCGRNAVQIHERSRPLDLEQLAKELEPLAGVRFNEFALRASIDPYELTVFPDGRAIIKGTTDVGVARSLYARYVGT